LFAFSEGTPVTISAVPLRRPRTVLWGLILTAGRDKAGSNALDVCAELQQKLTITQFSVPSSGANAPIAAIAGAASQPRGRVWAVGHYVSAFRKITARSATSYSSVSSMPQAVFG
jgi:hypothetical protein